jgi:hypothetical protein
MTDIFGEQRFSDALHLVYAIYRIEEKFNRAWDNHIHILNMNTFKSDYNSMDDLEYNVVAKKIKEEACKFYHDKSKNFDERLKVFNKYAEHKTYIYNPRNVDLNGIFDIAMEDDMYDRHQTIDTSCLIENWIDSLTYNRLSLDWKNPYHPVLVKKERNYKPSKEAINRLNVYYLEKLMLEEVKSFELDW